MLVLSRKEKEQIMIGEDVTITLLRIDGNKVRIGIDAPKEVRVIRGELRLAEQQAAALDGSEDRSDAGEQISDREQAFAHAQQPRHRPATIVGPKVSADRQEAKPVVAKLRRAPGNSVKTHAPLADYMTAG